ncbi:MAG: hypothetical protein HOO12_04415 [Methylococcales bacterium]|nr:hypothetical protein [Methylococcales bacterium]MBT4600219.1 hypothetical protein [Methylococcales bacterium]MBT4663483.1 hypothetical protein [Methylococcales bacterium]MBT4765979.1 hypothetical protein [Methylococcales bacterium]MBT6522985.1 hypothetical protein [Methylococcales bacterium]
MSILLVNCIVDLLLGDSSSDSPAMGAPQLGHETALQETSSCFSLNNPLLSTSFSHRKNTVDLMYEVVPLTTHKIYPSFKNHIRRNQRQLKVVCFSLQEETAFMYKCSSSAGSNRYMIMGAIN